MSVYVDTMEASFGRMVMCHMLADSTAELLEMADRIGVQRKWLQKPGTYREHFDICKSKRVLAVRHGAVELEPEGLRALLKRKAQERAVAPGKGQEGNSA